MKATNTARANAPDGALPALSAALLLALLVATSLAAPALAAPPAEPGRNPGGRAKPARFGHPGRGAYGP